MGRFGKLGEFTLRYAVFFGGMTTLALGIVICIQAQLGVSPWDVLQIGLSYVTPLSVGMASVFVGFVLVLITVALERKAPSIGCLINMVYVGTCIDLIILTGWIPTFEHIAVRSLALLVGIGLMGFGSGMYVMARRGNGPRDGLTLALCKLTGWSLRKVRILLELTVVAVGWLLGGPVFLGTLIASLLFGPAMQASMKAWGRWLDPLWGDDAGPGTKAPKAVGHSGASVPVGAAAIDAPDR